MSEAKPMRVSTPERKAPCYVLETEGNHSSQTKADTMKDLIARVAGVSDSAQKIKDLITEKLLVTALPKGNFLIKEEFTVTEEKKIYSSKNFVPVLKDHYRLLSKLVNYTEYARTNDKIATKQGANTLKGKLLDIETELYQILCDIKIALLGQGDDAQIANEGHQVSSAFRSAAKSFYNEKIRTYILMNDCQDVMTFLREMYTVM